MARELSFVQSVERSISKTYRERLWTPFITAIKNYKLIEEGDKIAVCISGGKDSMLMAKLIQMLHRHSDVKFDVEYLVMDPGYNEINRQKIESNAKLLEIPITVFETNIFDVANNTERSPCYVCAKMRRGHLYHKAKDLGCNKIALGHHLSDVIETTVMAMFYGSQLQGMMPKLHSLNFGGMELIRPMYCINEQDIINWKNYNGLQFIQSSAPCIASTSKTLSTGKITTGCSLSSAPAALPKAALSVTTAVAAASVKKSRRSSSVSSAKTRTSKRASSTACTPSASRRSPATRPAANRIRSWTITKNAYRRKGKRVVFLNPSVWSRKNGAMALFFPQKLRVLCKFLVSTRFLPDWGVFRFVFAG